MMQGAGVAPSRRHWPRRLLLGVNVFLVACTLAAAGAFGYFRYRFGQIDKVDIACHVLRNCGDDDADEPMNVLLVGSDSRKDLTPAEQRAFGTETEVGGQRSDTIIVLHVDPAARKAALLSIPRDLAVPIAGSGSAAPRRINTAFERGGPAMLIDTIDQALGIPIDHYAEVDFDGFRGIVEAVGGVTVYFPSPTRDKMTGLDIPRAGCVELDGEGALKYVRAREYEQFQSGRWRADPTADVGRIARQQDFISRVLNKASKAGRNPVKLNSLVATAVKNVTIDKAFSRSDIVRLVRRFKSLSPDTVDMLPLPATPTRIGGAAVLRLDRDEAGPVIARFNGQAAPPAPGQQAVAPASVRVRVLNGSGADGQAGDVAQELQAAHFNVAGTGDADSFRYPRTLIRYGRGQLAKAQLLQSLVGGGAQLREDRALLGVDLVLVTGSGFSGIRTTAAPGRPITTAPAKPPVAATAQPRGAPAQPPC